MIEVVQQPRSAVRLSRWRGRYDAPHLGVYLGLLVVLVAAVLLVVAWGRTAGSTAVGLQVPYVVSAGFTGIALAIVGVALVSVSAQKADADERARQMAQLCALLAELRQALEGDAE